MRDEEACPRAPHPSIPYPLSLMDKDEFERIKAAEKEHLRKLRDLKQQHRGAQRKVSTLNALKGMLTPDQDATHDEFTGKVAQSAAMSEARLEMAQEEAARIAQEEADAEVTRQSEAEALIRQMKAELGGDAASGGAPAPRNTPEASSASGASGKTIGRTPPEPDAPDASAPERGAKSIGRRRGQ